MTRAWVRARVKPTYNNRESSGLSSPHGQFYFIGIKFQKYIFCPKKYKNRKNIVFNSSSASASPNPGGEGASD